METYKNLYHRVRQNLRDAGIEANDIEARLLVEHASGKSRNELIISGKEFIDCEQVILKAQEMLARRIKGEPIAYILGEWEFYGLPISVTKDVLIPRVDTEVLASTAISLIKGMNAKPRVLDLCAGSGCVGIAIAANAPQCSVVFADKYENALTVCRANMLKNNLSQDASTVIADALEPPAYTLGSFDIIVCNPPYIPTKDLASIEASVRDYEPICALDGGTDGLVFYRAITENWSTALKDGGYLALECGVNQAQSVKEIMHNSEFMDIKSHADTLGIERVVIGQKSHSTNRVAAIP